MDKTNNIWNKYGRYIRGSLKLSSLIAGAYLAYRLGVTELTLMNVGAMASVVFTAILGTYFMRG